MGNHFAPLGTFGIGAIFFIVLAGRGATNIYWVEVRNDVNLQWTGETPVPTKYYLPQNVSSIKVERLYFMEFIKENSHVSLLS